MNAVADFAAMARAGVTRLPAAAFDVSQYEHDGYQIIHVRAGNRGQRRIVPPAGERSAFMVTDWARRVEISVSPSGRSVRVWVDGQEVKLKVRRETT